jgi:DNA topoisomerase-1
MKHLVIVESPAKARTIERYLGKDFTVRASYGHVRDLPKSKLGVDVEHNFAPEYIIPKKSQKNVTELKKQAKAADDLYLATDLDREGEAIAWHVLAALGFDESSKVHRITFNEITEEAIKNAIAHPRTINENLVDAQQARRVLDRLVGYELSPLLWKKIRSGLSAGRVQSVAVRLIVEREREIDAFKPKEYWSIEAQLSPEKEKRVFTASLIESDGKKIGQYDIPKEADAKKLLNSLNNSDWSVAKITAKQVKRNPSAAFITSTLQQEAARKLRFSTKKTMMLAQQLYEGVTVSGKGSIGLITYMRTDSVALSQQAITQARAVIKQRYGADYVPASPRVYKSKSGAQEAHEAIRPTDFRIDPESLKSDLAPDQLKLYTLIYRRAIASQMAEAKLEQTTVDILAKSAKSSSTFRATGSVVTFPGFLEVYLEGTDDEEEATEGTLPKLSESQKLDLQKLDSVQHFTQPPPRFTEATLIKALEERGIGRPSTYSPTISTIQDRGYVRLEQRRFFPNDIGKIVNDFLVEHFANIVDYDFTRSIEEELDDIADGKMKWQKAIEEFYTPFHQKVESGQEAERVKMPVRESDEKCPVCGAPMVIKTGRFGEFLACSRYPECKGTKAIMVTTGITCPKCKEGEIVERKTRKGRTFWGCSRYPKCDYATWNNPVAKEKSTA